MNQLKKTLSATHYLSFIYPTHFMIIKNIAFCILVLSFNLVAHGQQSLTKTTSNDRPLVFIDSLKTDFAVLVIDPKHIESVNVFKDSSAKALYGEAGKFGVVKIKSKPSA